MPRKKLIIDTNILLLIIIGSVRDGAFIKSSKRLGAYDRSDYDLINETVRDYEELYITPYIAAEVSNLIDLTGEAKREAQLIAQSLFASFKQIKSMISTDAGVASFLEFGLTDSSLIELSPHYSVLTDDKRVWPKLHEAGCKDVIDYRVNT